MNIVSHFTLLIKSCIFVLPYSICVICYIVGTALGVPPAPYSGYKPEIRPIIDTFFSTVTFRYGHSEVRYKL